MKHTKLLFSIFLLTALAIGCKVSPQPSKAQLILDLQSIHELLAKGDNMAAVDHFKGPEGVSKDELARNLKGLIDKREISAQGIQVLDKHGKFGKLTEVFPEKGERWMERNEIGTPEDCYGLGYKRAEVAAYWNGSKFLIIRLDDVGKLN